MGDLPRAAGPALIPFMTPNQTLIRRRDPHRSDSWLIYLGDVHVGQIARAVGNPGAAERWTWTAILKHRQRDLTPVLRRPVEPVAKTGPPTMTSYCLGKAEQWP
jgi:hypothetical protein